MQDFNLSDAKRNALLKMAGKQLGTDPNRLKEKLEAGQLSEVVNSLDPEAKARVNGLLQNPQALQALLGNAQVQDLLRNLGNK